jgi:hypothetical protein
MIPKKGDRVVHLNTGTRGTVVSTIPIPTPAGVPSTRVSVYVKPDHLTEGMEAADRAALRAPGVRAWESHTVRVLSPTEVLVEAWCDMTDDNDSTRGKELK